MADVRWTRTIFGMAAASIGLLTAFTPSQTRAEDVRIGFISTFTGAQAMLGNELLDGFKLGLARSGGKLGGQPTTLILGDDQTKPDIARQLAEKMVSKDRVQIITGVNFSNVLLAIAKPVLDGGAILMSVNPGPTLLAGKNCNSHFFSMSYQNENAGEAMGQYFTQKGLTNVYLMAPNYPAGKDLMSGFKRFYKGTIKKEIYTQFEQLDYAAEIADIRSEKPGEIFFFYPGTLGINFLRQYSDAGLKTEIPLYSAWSLDQTVFKATGDTAIGAFSSTMWTESFDNPENKDFVAAFQKEYGRLPSGYAAQAFDTARLLDAAIRDAGDHVDDKDALAAAIKKANFTSVRGPFKFNNNNFPIQDFFVARVERDAQGQTVMTPVETVFTAHGDAYAKDCRM